MKLGSSNLGTPSSVWSSSPLAPSGNVVEMQNGRLAPDRLTQNLHFKKGPRGFVCVRCTALNDSNCQVLELSFLTCFCFCFSQTWLFPSPPHPFYFLVYLLYFYFQYPQFTSSSFSASAKYQQIHLLHSFLVLWSPSAYTLRSPVLLTQYISCSSNSYLREIQERNLDPIFSWMGC